MNWNELGFTAGIAWMDSAGQVGAAAGPARPGSVPEPRLRAALRRARTSDEPFASEAVPPSVFRSPAIVLVVPTHAGSGAVNGALAAGLGPEWLNGLVASLERVRGGQTVIVDRAGQLIVAPGFAGVRQVGADPLVRRAKLLAGGPGIVRSDSVDGARGLDGRPDQIIGFAYEPVRTGWTVFVGRDVEDAVGGALRTLRLQLAGLGLLVLVGVGGAALVGRRLDRLASERDDLLDAARSAEGRSAFLARAAAELDEQPRLSGRMQRLADLCVPDLGDRCIVELAADDGDPARRAVAAQEGPEPPPGSPSLAAPLVVGGRRIGEIRLSRREGGGEYGPGDAVLAERLAGQSALQLESARLYEREHAIAGVLQQSLLPEALPSVAGISLAARYLPAGVAVEAGGDWYEAFPLGEGRVALAVGDVVGKGARAAAAMGRLRTAMRAFAMEGLAPAEVLVRLSRFAETVPEARCATVAYAVVNAADGEVRYACAGHPYPLVVSAAGGVRWLEDGRGGPLAGWDGVSFREGRARLGDGDLLALYTDGLVERRHEGVDVGLARLAASAGSLAGARVNVICDRLLAALGADAAADDVALLVARRTGLRLPADDLAGTGLAATSSR